MPNLKKLTLDGCLDVTDAGLSNLKGLTSLESLNLTGSGVAGLDLTGLAELPSLREVTLSGDQFRGDDNSIHALKELLPNCVVSIERG